MAQKLVGSKGRAFIAPAVTGKGNGSLPKSRQSRKLEAAKQILYWCVWVDVGTKNLVLSPPSNADLYRLLGKFGYRWVEDNWIRVYPEWVRGLNA